MELVEEARKLPLPELQALVAALDEAVAQTVDAKFQETIEAGAFDRMAEEAREEYRAGQTKPLDEILDNESLS